MTDPLSELYPGIIEGAAERRTGGDDLAASVLAKSRESARVRDAFFEENAGALVAMARAMAEVFRAGHRLLTIGNGGSSCDAAHLAVEFNHPITVGRPSLSSIFLGSDVQTLTAVGNDVGFSAVYRRLVATHGRRGDALFAFSTSGDSENLVAALETGRALGLSTFAMLGNDGGAIRQSRWVDHLLVVPSESVHRVQETHVVAYHVLWDIVHTILHETSFARARGNDRS